VSKRSIVTTTSTTTATTTATDVTTEAPTREDEGVDMPSAGHGNTMRLTVYHHKRFPNTILTPL
jgi:hypothetical protein